MADPDEALIEAIAEALKEHNSDRMECQDHDGACCPVGDAHDMRGGGSRRHQARAVVAYLGLAEESQWAPISESGSRWKPRSREEAMRDAADWPVGVTYIDGSPADGITHVVHERRLVSRWTEVDHGSE